MFFNMNYSELEQSVIDKAANDMTHSIDFEVLATALIEFGWTEHKIEPWYRANHSVTSWCERTIKGEWTHLGNRFLFESKQDANWFALRWL